MTILRVFATAQCCVSGGFMHPCCLTFWLLSPLLFGWKTNPGWSSNAPALFADCPMVPFDWPLNPWSWKCELTFIRLREISSGSVKDNCMMDNLLGVASIESSLSQEIIFQFCTAFGCLLAWVGTIARRHWLLPPCSSNTQSAESVWLQSESCKFTGSKKDYNIAICLGLRAATCSMLLAEAEGLLGFERE